MNATSLTGMFIWGTGRREGTTYPCQQQAVHPDSFRPESAITALDSRVLEEQANPVLSSVRIPCQDLFQGECRVERLSDQSHGGYNAIKKEQDVEGFDHPICVPCLASPKDQTSLERLRAQPYRDVESPVSVQARSSMNIANAGDQDSLPELQTIPIAAVAESAQFFGKLICTWSWSSWLCSTGGCITDFEMQQCQLLQL